MGFHEEGKWWVSPSNYDPEVTGQFKFPARVEFLDTTLRDGEQQPSVILTKDEKVAIARKLSEVGVQRIEAGTPAVLKEDAEAIREICGLGLKADIYAFVRNMVADMKLARDCGVQGVIAEMIGSEHLLKHGKKWEQDRAIKSSIEATLTARDLGLKVTYFPADGSRADLAFLFALLDPVMAEGHIDSLTLVDTFGVLSPEGAAHRVGQIKARYPGKALEVHFHDDFGMGVSSTIAGLAAGAEVAHVTVNGLGERAGGAQLEAVAIGLEAMYGVKTGLETAKFKELSGFVEKLTRAPVAPTRPIVGDKIFLWETGLPSSLWVNCKDIDPLIMLPYKWTLTGHREPDLLIGKKSGKDNLKVWLRKTGLTVGEEKMGDLLQAVKVKSYAEKRDLTEAEFREIAGKFA
ncbi:MAG: pyruvate carboxyltransferase [Candidatus Adiutrix sp.]|jgi:isopropylmalate/homocitrate/citramalate synthase|nr:pyruvate carboxyltransferase [Candidatus Adiutrix sp.]